VSTEVPDVYDDLSFYVPCEHPTRYRGVEIRGATYELWSPNSDGIDYYPGAPLKEPVDSFDATSRYHDGRLGLHDWTLHPQHFYAKHPWLGFCLCPPVGVRDWGIGHLWQGVPQRVTYDMDMDASDQSMDQLCARNPFNALVLEPLVTVESPDQAEVDESLSGSDSGSD
jgi:hypothetical protein